MGFPPEITGLSMITDNKPQELHSNQIIFTKEILKKIDLLFKN